MKLGQASKKPVQSQGYHYILSINKHKYFIDYQLGTWETYITKGLVVIVLVTLVWFVNIY